MRPLIDVVLDVLERLTGGRGGAGESLASALAACEVACGIEGDGILLLNRVMAVAEQAGVSMDDRKGVGLFPRAEEKLFALFRARRHRGRRVTERWICLNARRLVVQEYGEVDDDKKAAAARAFKASHAWRHRWSKRFAVVPRKLVQEQSEDEAEDTGED